ncbi:putative prostate stem cell antigen-like [Scophthalmus maximus]|uniref:Putative prostate stem cell antigen-like n=1 Tax=Scophthalmus maximus TaxID=52904 RepID=A0A2U9BVC4_SCOMX|nr:putative prostate stem cell antigen-like [Scophthalmus maximus]
MMRLYGALILFMILSTEPLDRCFSVNVTGYMTKGCRKETNCVKPISCCEEDFCNSAIMLNGPRVALLLVSSAITALFL